MTKDSSDTIWISADGTSVSAFTIFSGGQSNIMAFRFRGRTYLKTERNTAYSGSYSFHGGRQLYAPKYGVFSTDPNDWISVSWPGQRYKGMAIGPGGASEIGQNWNFAACNGFMLERSRSIVGSHGQGRIAISRPVQQVIT